MGTPSIVSLAIVGLAVLISGIALWGVRARRREADESIARAR